MKDRDEDSDYLDTLRLTNGQLYSILDDALRPGTNRRKTLRRKANMIVIKAEIHQPGGSVGRYLVRAFDLSEGGAGLLHGQYIHPNSQCWLGIPMANGEQLGVDGKVARCVNLKGHVHLVGIEFDDYIDLSWFDEESRPRASEREMASIGVIDELIDLVRRDATEEDVLNCYQKLGETLGIHQDEDTDAGAVDDVDVDAESSAQ